MKYVKSEKPLSTEHKTLGEIKVDVEYPQVDSFDEFVTFAGGQDQALAFINGTIEDKAKGAGRIALRAIPENGNLEEATPRIQSIVKSYTPQASDGREVRAKKVAAFDQLQSLVASGKQLTQEQLMELLAAAK